MGAWGSEPFDNDDAGDWTYELEDHEDEAFLSRTLEAITSKAAKRKSPEAPECSRAIACAEVIAALGGRAGEAELPEEVVAWIKGKPGPSPDLVQKAIAALDAIATRSELKDLWSESDERDAWQESLSDLVKRLRSI